MNLCICVFVPSFWCSYFCKDTEKTSVWFFFSCRASNIWKKCPRPPSGPSHQRKKLVRGLQLQVTAGDAHYTGNRRRLILTAENVPGPSRRARRLYKYQGSVEERGNRNESPSKRARGINWMDILAGKETGERSTGTFTEGRTSTIYSVMKWKAKRVPLAKKRSSFQLRKSLSIKYIYLLMAQLCWPWTSETLFWREQEHSRG